MSAYRIELRLHGNRGQIGISGNGMQSPGKPTGQGRPSMKLAKHRKCHSAPNLMGLIKKMSRIINVAILILSSLTSGCYLSMDRMKAAHQSDINALIGKNHHEVLMHPSRAFIVGGGAPDKIIKDGDKLIYLYKNIYHYRSSNFAPCDVTLELDAREMIILNATSMGDGCYRAY